MNPTIPDHSDPVSSLPYIYARPGLFVGFAEDDFASVVALDCLLFQIHVWASRRPDTPSDFETAIAAAFPDADKIIPSIARKLALDDPNASPSELRETLIGIWKRVSTGLRLETELKPMR